MDLKHNFINALEQLEKLMSQKGEHFRARAYSKAKEAALKTTFEPNNTAPEIQVGTIIYNFKLN